MIILAGDVGGTKTLLLLQRYDGEKPTTVAEKRYENSHFDSLETLVADFLNQYSPDEKPDRACFAVAGPVKDGSVAMTNLSWLLSESELVSSLQIPKVLLINDFSGIAYGLEALSGEQLRTIQHGGTANLHSNISMVVGAGTGLGVATLMHTEDGRLHAIESEGGHIDFAAANPLQADLLTFLSHRYNGHVSIERLLSGMGLINIYQFLSQRGANQELSDDVQKRISQGDASFISQAAEYDDPVAVETIKLFTQIYGAQAGNLALVNLPKRGMYIAGGIVTKIAHLMNWKLFLDAFNDKGRMQPLLNEIPVYIVTEPKVGLVGAAVAAQQAAHQ